jgi:carbon storage regulator
MLVLGRKENQSIIIGDNIRVTIVGRSGSSIRIGVQAPREVPVIREEVTKTERDIVARHSLPRNVVAES